MMSRRLELDRLQQYPLHRLDPAVAVARPQRLAHVHLVVIQQT